MNTRKLADSLVFKLSRLTNLAEKLPKFKSEVDTVVNTTVESLNVMLKEVSGLEEKLSEFLAQLEFNDYVKKVRKEKDAEQTAIILHNHPALALNGELNINVCHPWSIVALCQKYPDLVELVDKKRMEDILGYSDKRKKYYNMEIRRNWDRILYPNALGQGK